MNRRHLLGTLLGAAAGLVLDPERMLWVPGAKKIFIPPPRKFYMSTFNFTINTDSTLSSSWDASSWIPEELRHVWNLEPCLTVP